MMTLSYLVWPIQILLIIPFIRVGEYVFSIPPTIHTLKEILTSFESDFLKTLSQLSFELFCGLGGWFVTAVPFSIGVYLTMIFLLKALSKKNRRENIGI